MVAKDATSVKRLAYIARRIRFLQELVARKVIRILDVPGDANPADAMTKHISPKSLYIDYMARAYNTTVALFKVIVARASPS